MEQHIELFSPANNHFAELLTLYQKALAVRAYMPKRMTPIGFDKSAKGYYIKVHSRNLYAKAIELVEFREWVTIAEARKNLGYVRVAQRQHKERCEMYRRVVS